MKHKHIFLIILLIVFAGFGTTFLRGSFAIPDQDRKKSIVDPTSEEGCWLLGRMWSTEQRRCGTTCRANASPAQTASMSERTMYCHHAIDDFISESMCVNSLHRRYVREVGCARRMNDETREYSRHCSMSAPNYVADFQIDFCTRRSVTGQFTIVSYNTRFDVSPQDTAGDIKSLVTTHDADILSLQELDRSPRRAAIRKAIISCKTCEFDGYTPDADGKNENPVYWRGDMFRKISARSIKVADKDAYGLPIRALYITYVELEFLPTGRRIVVMNSHLPSNVEENGRPAEHSEERIQLYKHHLDVLKKQLLATRQTLGDDAAYLITGDFNVSFEDDKRIQAEDFPYRFFGKQNTRSNYDFLPDQLPTVGTHNSRLIDYVFSPKAGKLTPIKQQVLRGHHSDHRALWVRFTIK